MRSLLFVCPRYAALYDVPEEAGLGGSDRGRGVALPGDPHRILRAELRDRRTRRRVVASPVNVTLEIINE